MSALIQTPNLFRSLRRVSEHEAIKTIGRLSLTANDAATGLESLASVALRLQGLHGVEIALASSKEGETFEWHDSQAPAPRGAATGLIAANSREWGRLRIFFEPRLRSVECPLRFARILSQNAALMLNRLELIAHNRAVQSAVRRLRERLETRKAVSRAAGIVAKTAKISEPQAVLLLLQQSRESRKPLLQLARTLILSQETGHLETIGPCRRGAASAMTANG